MEMQMPARDPQSPVEFVYALSESKITELAGVRLLDYYRDLELMVEAQRVAAGQVLAVLGLDVGGPYHSVGHVKGPEYLGARIHWPDDDEPMVAEPALAGVEEIRAFRLPDPPDHPVARDYLAQARRFYELTGRKSGINWEGAVSAASLALGAEQFYYLAVDEPELCERLLTTVTDGIIAWRRWHDAELGIDPPQGIGAADDMSAFLSPAMWRRFALPNLLRWYGAYPSARARSLHICGDTGHVLDQIAELGLTSFELGEMIDLLQAKRALPGVKIQRLLDFRVIRDNSPAEIRDYTLRELRLGAPGGNFVACVEGWRGTPLEKVRVVQDAVAEWNGR